MDIQWLIEGKSLCVDLHDLSTAGDRGATRHHAAEHRGDRISRCGMDDNKIDGNSDDDSQQENTKPNNRVSRHYSLMLASADGSP